MPNIKPINKLVTKARHIREHHRERHAPSGFAFALADSIDYLDQAHWQKVTPHDSLLQLWPAVAEAIYRLRRVDKLFGDTAFVMVKDIPDAYASSATALARFSYRELETEPNMVLDISPQWKTYDDYLASLTSKYRGSGIGYQC